MRNLALIAFAAVTAAILAGAALAKGPDRWAAATETAARNGILTPAQIQVFGEAAGVPPSGLRGIAR